MNKEDKEDDLPKKQMRLRSKQERKTQQRIKNILHDSRPARLIVEDVEADDKWLE